MNKTTVNSIFLGLCLVAFGCESNKNDNTSDIIITEANQVHFAVVEHIKYLGAFQQITNLNLDTNHIELANGSRWSISHGNLIKGWEKSKNLVITQSHSSFATPRYALVNLDLQLSEPITMEREPTPVNEVIFVKEIDSANNIILLSDNNKLIIHSSDRGTFNKISVNDRVLIGINTGNDRDKSPYLLIDTANHQCVRAKVIE